MTLVSAVIPVYNGESFVAEAVRSTLDQTHAEVECVVVDDGSTDATPDVVRAIVDDRVRYVRQENAGVSAARNRGIAEARGDYVAFLDADDVWLPNKTARQLRSFRTRPDLSLVVTGYTITDEHLAPRFTVLPSRREIDFVRLVMLEASGIGLSFTGMAPRALAERLGFSPRFATAADLELALRLRADGPVEAVIEPLALYRTHSEQMHLDLEAYEDETTRIFDDWLVPGTSLEHHRRRAKANLYTRLALYEASRRRWPQARGHALTAMATRPDRLLGLPAWAAMTRVRRLLALRRIQGGIGS